MPSSISWSFQKHDFRRLLVTIIWLDRRSGNAEASIFGTHQIKQKLQFLQYPLDQVVCSWTSIRAKQKQKSSVPIKPISRDCLQRKYDFSQIVFWLDRRDLWLAWLPNSSSREYLRGPQAYTLLVNLQFYAWHWRFVILSHQIWILRTLFRLHELLDVLRHEGEQTQRFNQCSLCVDQPACS